MPAGRRGRAVFACKGDALTRRPAEQQRLFSRHEQSLTAPLWSRPFPCSGRGQALASSALNRGRVAPLGKATNDKPPGGEQVPRGTAED